MISVIEQLFDKNNIKPASGKLVAGVSGGLDSMVMLYILKQLGFDVQVVHINYKKRGLHSDADATLVEQISRKYGFDFNLFEYQDECSSGNFQEAARNFRREKFIQVADQINAKYVVLGHHSDDQVETILHKIFRGAGLNALSGMKLLDGRFFRPLLFFKKTELLIFANQHKLTWRDDASNEESIYGRNWIRNEFAQKLDNFFPGWSDNVLKHGQRLEAINELIDAKLANEEDQKISLSQLAGLSDELQLIVLHRWLNRNNIFVTEGELAQILKLKSSQPGSKIPLTHQFDLIRDRRHFRLTKNSQLAKKDQSQRVVGIPHKNPIGLSLANHTILFSLYLNSVPDIGQPAVMNDSRTDRQPIAIDSPLQHARSPKNRLILDYETMKFPLTVETWQKGDKFKPLGMNSSKLISDLLTDRKIDSSQKNNALKITDFDGNICAVIFPHPTSNGEMGNIGEDYKITDQTNSIIEIHITQHNEL